MPSAVKMAEVKAVLCIAAALSLIHSVTAADYVVGRPAGGWGGGTVDYKSWAAAQTFAPGDTLTFKYNSYHNVVEVTKEAYEACSAANPVSSDNSGTTTIVLTAPGKRYFICGAPGHCQSGMKLEVDVADRPAPTTPSPPPLLPPSPRHAKRRPAAPAPMPLPPAPKPWSPAPAPAPAAAQRKRSGHKKHKRRHLPPNPAPAMAPTVQSVEADFPAAAFAPMSSPPPPPPMSSEAAAVVRTKWSEAMVWLVALGLVVLTL